MRRDLPDPTSSGHGAGDRSDIGMRESATTPDQTRAKGEADCAAMTRAGKMANGNHIRSRRIIDPSDVTSGASAKSTVVSTFEPAASAGIGPSFFFTSERRSPDVGNQTSGRGRDSRFQLAQSRLP